MGLEIKQWYDGKYGGKSDLQNCNGIAPDRLENSFLSGLPFGACSGSMPVPVTCMFLSIFLPRQGLNIVSTIERYADRTRIVTAHAFNTEICISLKDFRLGMVIPVAITDLE
jgi:hypothetical protein